MRDANSGYIGFRMSRRAAEAYESGEKPLSKWKKQEIINLVNSVYGADIAEAVKHWTLASLKRVFLYKSSWHHTSKFFNVTDFYSFDEDLLTSEADLWEKYENKQETDFKANNLNKNIEIEICYNKHKLAKEKNRLFYEHEQEQEQEYFSLLRNTEQEIYLYEKAQAEKFLMLLVPYIQKLPDGSFKLKSGFYIKKETTVNNKKCLYVDKKAAIVIHGDFIKTYPENFLHVMKYGKNAKCEYWKS